LISLEHINTKKKVYKIFSNVIIGKRVPFQSFLRLQ